MSHYHFFPCDYFPSHFIRLRLVLNVNVFFVEFILAISGRRFRPESFLLVRSIFLNEIHVFRTLKFFRKVHIDFLAVTKMIEVAAAAWLWNLLKLSFETQLLLDLLMGRDHVILKIFVSQNSSFLGFSLDFETLVHGFFGQNNLWVSSLFFLFVLGFNVFVAMTDFVGNSWTEGVVKVFIFQVLEEVDFTHWTMVVLDSLVAITQIVQVLRVISIGIFSIEERSLSSVKWFFLILFIFSGPGWLNNLANGLGSIFLLTASLALQIISQGIHLRVLFLDYLQGFSFVDFLSIAYDWLAHLN